jgi:hypothetical protein
MSKQSDLVKVSDGTIAGNLDVTSGTIKLDGNYPVGTGNVALGDTALDSNVSGASNVAIGADALTANTASQNTAVGYQASYANTTGTENQAFGYFALISNTTGSYNTALGRSALQENTTADYNVAVGKSAGLSTTSGIRNVFIGPFTGTSNTTGTYNTYVGGSTNCAYEMTTGSKNTILGGYNGNQGGLDIRTSSNNIVLSDGDGNPRIYVSSSGCVSIGTVSTTTDAISRFGGSSSVFSQKMVNAYGGGTAIHAENTNNQGWIYARFNTNGSQVGYISVGTSSTSYVTSSDYRLKENVVYDWDATTRLKQLKPARFNFIVDADTTVDGFLAHEAQAVVRSSTRHTQRS